MAIPVRCVTVRNDKIIALKENKSCFRFLNPDQKEIECILVDGCAVKEGIRCDYLLIDANKTEHFIELKGTDISYAAEQLEVSIKRLSRDKGIFKYSFIVAVRCPLSGTDIQLLKKKFKRNYHSELIIKNSPFEHLHK